MPEVLILVSVSMAVALAANSAQPAVPAKAAAAIRKARPVRRGSACAAEDFSGSTMTGSSRQNSCGSSIRPCMKSPPTRISYTVSRTPLPSMSATTATGVRSHRLSR